MWQKIKQWPISVHLAIVWLASIWTLLGFMWPGFVIIMTIVALVVVSIGRIVSYFMDGR